MNTALIEVEAVVPPGDGKKQAVVKTRNGQKFGLWPKNMGLLRPGRTYEVTFTERKWNDKTYRTIEEITLAPNAMAPIEQERSSRPAPSIDKNTNQEFEFTTRLLCSMVQYGRVAQSEEELAKAALMLRGAYRRIFG